MSEESQNKEPLSDLGREVVSNISLVWVRRRIFGRLLPLWLLLLGALVILAQRVFWERVFVNMPSFESIEDILRFIWAAYLHTGRAVQIALFFGVVLVLLSIFQLASVLRRLLARW